tara:strand:- start:782 stop:1342 length:561 start_codon:yes stop_codon:yes gene_type:complete
MIFLTNSDIKKQLDDCLLEDVLSGNDYLLDESERYSIEVSRAYLQPRYNTDMVFIPYVDKSTTPTNEYFDGLKLLTASTSGNQADIIECVGTNGTGGFVIEPDCRDYVLKDIILSIAIYDLERKVAYRQIPIMVQDKHDLAIKMLEDINRGRMTINLPYKSDETVENQQGFGIVHGKNTNSIYNKY